MLALPSRNPNVYENFTRSSFVVLKTNRKFSAIALVDHAHEQVNSIVKGQGGAVGLTENSGALRR